MHVADEKTGFGSRSDWIKKWREFQGNRAKPINTVRYSGVKHEQSNYYLKSIN